MIIVLLKNTLLSKKDYINQYLKIKRIKQIYKYIKLCSKISQTWNRKKTFLLFKFPNIY